MSQEADAQPSVRPEIVAYYERGGELDRLLRGRGRLEFVRTQEILRRLLPPPPAVVLDVGGGSGVHAAWLAADGHRVTVIDPIPLHVEEAARLPGVDACLGDARALPVASASADVVLSLGPLYHLTEEAERVHALREARRVARPGALLAVATINRFAGLHDMLMRSLYLDDHVREVIDAATSDGLLRNTIEGFTTAYLHHPEQVITELEAAGWLPEGQYGLEGAAHLMPHTIEWLDDEHHREALLAALRHTESHPSVLGISGHVITAARPSTPASRPAG